MAFTPTTQTCSNCLHKNVCKHIDEFEKLRGEADKIDLMRTGGVFRINVTCVSFTFGNPDIAIRKSNGGGMDR